ncbi:decaprenyl-phosphate phosphoribosyltransferase [Geobacter sp. AOG1]|uniref:decaprenyl-phosphate phosphoribosyltransferase n=1 Tax=Geobacter sp. AOG1 TaxID=1566346 RepID=UPI001CC41152|nr:decaprenyl-phosphate phosphoribosyltransferase [Geobacter sp. AOG1]GFE58468.1 decaprenyl-phosphate phosphoribosyltransferase [Geobacter sp. AOG1]
MMAAYLTMLRPVQWLKNLMIFFPPLLAGQIVMPDVLGKGLSTFCAFCLMSSAGYVFNDLLDRERDLNHPRKRFRPVPSGVINVQSACISAILLCVLSLLLAWLVSYRILPYLAGYAVVSVLYSLFLKHIPIVDLFGISAGFLIRLQAGGELFQIPISPWLFLTVFLLSVFLSTGKRLSESLSLGVHAGKHRTSLSRYPEGFLAGTMYMTGTVVLVTYAMYTLNKHKLLYSVPLCLFGLLRFILRVTSGKGGDPTEALLNDSLLLLVGLLWVALVVWSIYL